MLLVVVAGRRGALWHNKVAGSKAPEGVVKFAGSQVMYRVSSASGFVAGREIPLGEACDRLDDVGDAFPV
jgi:hypothetical protein